jgi:hypothetical protein
MIKSILDYFKTDRSWDGGVKLFFKYSRNKAFQRKIQIQGETQRNLEMLHYQLWKLTGLPERQLRATLNEPVSKVPEPDTKAAPLDTNETNDTLQEKKPATMTVQEATRMKLRDEFPFLGETSCPDSLKVLVSDMLTAHDKYVQAHQDLYEISDEKQAFEAADAVIDNYLDNRAIWDELVHYKKTGKILGNHPYFEELNRRKELQAMSVPELIKLEKQLSNNIWRNKNKLEKDPKPHLEKSRKANIAEYEADLKFVKGLLNLK